MESFSIFRVLNRSLSVFFGNIVAVLIIGAVIYSPLLGFGASLYFGDVTLEKLEMLERAALGSFVLGLIATGALTYLTVEHVRGHKASIGQALVVGIKRLLPVILVSILVGVAVGVGLILLVIPGLILLCGLWVAVPASVMEKPGIIGALGRSWDLTADNKLQIFGLLFLVGLANQGIVYLMEHQFIGGTSIDPQDVKLFILVACIWSMITGVFGAILAAVGYVELRATEHSYSAEESATAMAQATWLK